MEDYLGARNESCGINARYEQDYWVTRLAMLAMPTDQSAFQPEVTSQCGVATEMSVSFSRGHMNFDRHKSFYSRSWAFSAFAKHHTEVNDMYWSFVPAWSYANYLAKNAPGDSTPQALFCASGPNVRRLANSTTDFIEHFDLLANWVRLSALMSALSYFEVYLKRTITIGVMSDPAARLGKSKAIDGVIWLKSGLRDELLDPLITSCVKGDWVARVVAFRRLFGVAPSLMQNNISELDRIRVIRNKVGHAFGRPIKVALLETAATEMERISEENLQGSLELIYKVAQSTDEMLLHQHIGAFEEVLFFHELKSGLKGQDVFNEVACLRTALNKLCLGSYVGNEYCQELVEYYNSIM